MDDESVSLVSGDALPKLLERPIGSWMSGHVKVKNTPACDFHDDEYIDQLERCRYQDKEIAGDDCFGMIANERHPALRRVGGTFGCFGHVAPHSPRRNSNSDFEQQFVGNTLLTPSRIVYGHVGDELPDVDGYARTATRPGFPFPKQAEAFAMPPNQGIGFDYDESLAPVKPSGKSGQSEADRIGRSSWFDLTIKEEAELFA